MFHHVPDFREMRWYTQKVALKKLKLAVEAAQKVPFITGLSENDKIYYRIYIDLKYSFKFPHSEELFESKFVTMAVLL